MNGLGRMSCGLLIFTGLACGRFELSDADDPAALIVGVPDDAATFDSLFASTPAIGGCHHQHVRDAHDAFMGDE